MERACDECGGPLPPHIGGPPRRFCGITCKENARGRLKREATAERKKIRDEAVREYLESNPGRWKQKQAEREAGFEPRACVDCGEVKPADSFYRTGSGYPRSRCKDCQKALQVDRYASDPNERERAKQKAKRWDQRNPERARVGRQSRCHRYKVREYGLTHDEWVAMLVAQSGRCLICSEPMVKPCVDHVHDETNRVRGLLCGDCNKGLGCFQDNPVRLRAAIEYLTL